MNKQTLIGLAAGLIIGGASMLGASAVINKSKPEPNHNVQTTAKLQSLEGDDFDKAFIDEMVMHHQGAIDMAKLIETNASHNELKQLGRDIISAQSKEIDMMQTWQTDWGYKTMPQSHDTH